MFKRIYKLSLISSSNYLDFNKEKKINKPKLDIIILNLTRLDSFMALILFGSQQNKQIKLEHLNNFVDNNVLLLIIL
jgi:hypothetical protein